MFAPMAVPSAISLCFVHAAALAMTSSGRWVMKATSSVKRMAASASESITDEKYVFQPFSNA